MLDPKDLVTVLGTTLISGMIMYVIVEEVQTDQNVTDGLWDLGLFLLSVVPVAFAIMYIFR